MLAQNYILITKNDVIIKYVCTDFKMKVVL
jgi:hypothetical protein